MKYLFPILLLIGLSCLKGMEAIAQAEDEKTRILFILDASQSMNANWGGNSRMEVAKSILTDIVDTLKQFENVEMALRIYGHQYSYTLNNCKDSRLEVPFGKNNVNTIKSRLSSVTARGITPIAYSLERSEKDFPHDANSRNIVILITDGEESCKGDPCAVSQAIQRRGLILKPFVIGLGSELSFMKNLDCIGAYHQANTVDDFKNILQQILKKVLDKTTTQVNILDEYGVPSETNINMTFFNPATKVAQYSYYHTINAQGNPDTVNVDPINTYNLILHTIPPVEKPDVRIEANRHNIIPVPAPQGQLKVQVMGMEGSGSMKIRCIVRKNNSYETLNVQSLNTGIEYLTGTYDLEILTLPRVKINDVEVSQSKTTTITIPEPGLITFYSSVEIYGGIFVMQDNKLKKIYQLNDRILKETIALQPGNYVVIYRNKFNRDADLSIYKPFKVQSGQSATIKL